MDKTSPVKIINSKNTRSAVVRINQHHSVNIIFEISTSAKKSLGLDDIIIVASRHVEMAILLSHKMNHRKIEA